MFHLTIKIYGHVQGVNFRYYAIKKAMSWGLVGFVKNDNDGSVYIEAEGEKENLEKLLEWCHQGPAYAEVEKMNYTFSEDVKGYREFEIRY